MRRPAWLRVVLALWAMWFNAALLEAPGIHTCAVHAGVVAHQEHASAEMTMPMSHDMAAAHDDSSPSSHKGGCECTCLGTCCGVTPFVASDAAPNIVAHYAALVARRIGQDVTAPGVNRPYARPFANGPPTLV